MGATDGSLFVNVITENRGDDYNEPILIGDVLQNLNIYSDLHRHMLQYLLSMKNVCTAKQFCCELLRFYTCRIAKRNPNLVQYIDANGRQLEELVNRVVKSISRELKWMKMTVQKVPSEVTGKELIVMCNQHPYSAGLLTIAELKPDEVFVFCKLLEKIFSPDGDGTFTLGFAMTTAERLPNKMSGAKLQELMDKLVMQNWIGEENGVYYLKTRSVCEIDALLRSKFRPTCCELCSRIIIRREFAYSCPQCEILMHKHCLSTYVLSVKDEQMRCPGKGSNGKACLEFFSKDDILGNCGENRRGSESNESEAEMITD